MVIGFVGTGVMGSSMARRLLQNDYEVMIYTRTKEKAQPILSEGAEWGETIANVARSSDVIITMVGYPSDVEEVYFGESGILENAEKGTYVIDMTTSKPALAQRIYETAKEKQLHALDAPVSGGDIGAREGRLTIMVGGDEESYEKMRPIFDILGANVVLQGEAGAGQHTKMANQITIASNMVGVCEAIVYAQKAGLDPEKVLTSIESGSAGSWSLSYLAPRMLKEDFEPGFYVKHFIKDMTIALEAAEDMNLMTPGLELSKSLYDKLAKEGDENSGTQALIKLYAKDLG